MAKSGSTRRWIIFLVFILIVAGGSWYYWTHHGDKAPDYYTAQVTRGEIVQTVTATGQLQPVLDVAVSCQISGNINTILVDFNSPVKKDQVIATIEPSTYNATVKSAEADVANAQANYDLQNINAQREKELWDKKLVAQADYDSAVALLKQAEAQMQLKQATLDMARINLARCTIYSPIDGIVISRNVDVGNTVAVSLSAPELFEIANDLTKMQIDAAVAEADVGSIEVGQTVNFTVDAYPDRQFHGRVSQIRNAPKTQQNVVIYDTMIDVNNADLKLKPGMTANVSIILARRADALRIANSALRVRLPDGVLPPPPAETKPAGATAGATPAKPMSEDERRQQLRQLMSDAGFVRGSGPPSPEVIQRAQQLAKERGIELPDRFTGGGNKGNAPVVRTVYRLPGGDPMARPEAVQVKLGITDGVNTEVLDGLKEGDVIITGLGSTPGGSSRSASPFGGGFGRRF